MPAKPWHAMTSGDAATALGVDPKNGLSPEDAASRIKEYGPNALTSEEPVSALTIFLNQFKNILTLILIAAIILSAAVGEVTDAAIISVIVIFCAVLGFVQEFRSEKALESLNKMLTPVITVLRGGEEIEIESVDLVPGDLLLLEAGDVIPADARLLEAHAVACDEASLTGESVPAKKSSAALPEETPMADRRNMVFAGTVMSAGRGRAIITATGMRAELGKIAGAVSNVKSEPTPLERRTNEIGKWLGIAAGGICLIVAGVSVLRESLTGAVSLPFLITVTMFSISLAVAAVPEALAAIVTGALAIGMRKMAKENALIRKMPAVETLGCATVICTDKTGTLTTGEMTVREIYAAGKTVALGDNFSTPAPDSALGLLLSCGALCNDARFIRKNGTTRAIGGHTDAALLLAADKAGLDRAALTEARPRVGEIPFSSERKRMTTVHAAPEGPFVCAKGAPEIILDRCDRIHDANGPRPLTDDDRRAIRETNNAMADRAMRVLALAYNRLPATSDLNERDPDAQPLETGLIFLGLAAIMDPPRPEAAKAVAACRRVGIRPVMITGDHMATAQAVAREIGIFRDGDRALTGAELDAMDETGLAAIVESVSVYARVSPLHKLMIVKAWKAKNQVVAMTGDGVNDAPALKHADIGVAMGITGTEVSKEAADMILLDDNFATIVKAIELGRWIYDNIKKYLTFLLRCNITEVAVIGGVVLALGPDHLPLLPAAILYINLATDGLPALALGVAPPDPDIMERPPRNPSESVFSPDVRLFLLVGVLLEIPLFLAAYAFSAHDPVLARTRLFFMFIIIEIIIALNFRSMKWSALKAPPHFWLVFAAVWEAVLIAVLIHIPSIREAFGISIPSYADLSLILALGAVIFCVMEGVKVVIRKRDI